MSVVDIEDMEIHGSAWANGLGVWYASVSVAPVNGTTPPMWSLKMKARELILRELVERERKTWETLDNARSRIGEVLRVKPIGGDQWDMMFVEAQEV